MQEDIDIYFETAEESMQNAIRHLQHELLKIRTGKATPALLDDIHLDYYGSPTPLKQVANIKVPEARTLTIEAWEKKMLQEIEKAIFAANLGITPQNDGKMIRINLPPLTEERRRELAKQAKGHGEHAKVGIRNARRDLIASVKDAVKNGYPEDAGKKLESEADEMMKQYYTKVEHILEVKEKEIMTV